MAAGALYQCIDAASVGSATYNPDMFVAASLFLVARLAHTTAVPQPFPRPGVQPPSPRARHRRPSLAASRRPRRRAATRRPPRNAAPTEGMLGVPIYPGAQFIRSYDAGRGQRYYIFGSAASFVDLVSYYRTMLKQKGDLVFDVPATHEFDVGKFNEDTMAFPPGVTIKDFQSDVSQGYPNPKPGGQPPRFPTIIQIVPVTERESGRAHEPASG